MSTIYKLHTYCNSVYYAVMYNCESTSKALLTFSSFFKHFSKKMENDPVHDVRIMGLGPFVNFTDDFCNGRVNETCSHRLNEGENFDENIRPWQKYDYVNKKFVDWYGPLVEKGDDNEEFKKAYAFSYKASFESSLINSGVLDKHINNMYIFEVLNYKGEPESGNLLPFELPDWFITEIDKVSFLS